MKRSLSDTTNAVFKRNKRKLLNFLSAFPPGERPPIPNRFLDLSSKNDADQMEMNSNDRQGENTTGCSSQEEGKNKKQSATENLHFDINNGLLELENRNDDDVDHEDDNNVRDNNDENYDSLDSDEDDDDDDDEEDEEDEDDEEDEEDEDDEDEEKEEEEEEAYGIDDNDGVQNRDDNSVLQNTRFLTINNKPSQQVPLIAKRNITVRDHVLAAVATSVRHKLTFEATVDQLQWIKSTYHTNAIPKTKEKLWEFLGRNDHILTHHYYCRNCHDYLGEKDKETNELQTKCIYDENDDSESRMRSFININLTSQIEELLSIPNISESLKYRFRRTKIEPNAYEDIYDGEEYKSLCLPGKLLEKWYNFSFTFNTDGCNVAKSSNSSAWPIYVQINELPPHMRKKHMLLAAIYVDDEHPVMNHFLRPLTDEIRKLYTEGVKWKPSNSSEVISKFIVTTCSLDSPARAAVTCLNQFNGYYGCLYCYAKGQSLGRSKFVYHLRQCYKKQRSDAELRDNMVYAFDKNKIRHGVKNISSLIALPQFNIPKGVVVEAMHAVYLGVVQQHTRIFLTNSKKPYYVGNPDCISSIDKCLLAIKPPSCRSRKPRSILTYKKWKASEWRNWLDYGPVCLKDILPAKYIDHPHEKGV